MDSHSNTNYCPHCGRELHGHCVCLATNPIPKSHVWLLYLILIVLPVANLSIVKQDQTVWDINYWFVCGVVLSAILIGLTLLNGVFQKPYLALLFGCHQRRSRTMKLFGTWLPLCARCTGIYLGVFIATMLHLWLDIPWYWNLILAVPLLLDGWLQHKQSIESNNIRRLITGLLFGVPLVGLFTLYHVLVVWLGEIIVSLFL